MLPHGLVVMTIGVLLSDLGNDHYSPAQIVHFVARDGSFFSV